MKLFSYTMSFPCSEYVAGVVQANNIINAKQILRMTYSDWDDAETEIKEVEFDSKGLCEIYYGGY